MGLLEGLITGIFILALLSAYVVIAFILAMFIQLISYRVFKINIYKTLIKRFMEV